MPPVLTSAQHRLARLAAAFAAIPAPIRSAIFMTTAAGLFSAMNGVIRYLSQELHPFEVVFFRNLAGLAFMLPWLFRSGLRALRTDHHRLYLGRSLVGLLAMLTWFSALSLMPLAEATALGFTAPLFATLAAVLILREVVRARRWTATLIGFLGAMIVLRPGFAEVGLAHTLVLTSAGLVGIGMTLVKQLTRVEPANAIVTYMTLYILPASAVLAAFVWKMPSPHLWPWIVLLGLVATLAHQAITRAYTLSEASALQPFEFARMPFAALIGWLAFAEEPDVWTWVGAAVIAGSTGYIAHREAAIARAARARPPAATVAVTGEAAVVASTRPEAEARRP